MRQYYTLAIFAFLFIALQCKSPEYYINKNKPDAAYRFASRKLKKDNIKTKHLQILEYGYNTANERDINIINQLKEYDNLKNWKRIHYLNQQMLSRHDKIEPYLPLVSFEGYRAYLRMYPVKEWEEESFWRVTDLFLKEIRDNLFLGAEGYKLRARIAYHLIDELMNDHGFIGKEMSELIDSSIYLGTAYFGLNFFTKSNYREEAEIVDKLYDYNYFFKKGKWKTIELNPDKDLNYDFIVDVEVWDSYTSENTNSSCERFEKEIEIGKKEIIDTAGNVTREPIYKTVEAEIVTYTLTKDATIRANITVYSPKNNQTILKKRIYGTDSYCDSYCTLNGDGRATSKSCNGFSPGFPSDRQMINNCVRPLGRVVMQSLKKIDVSE